MIRFWLLNTVTAHSVTKGTV